MAKKSSMGRPKIVIVKIPRKNRLQVTFSKLCSSLFKKASELCTLFGLKIAIIVFSPAGKPFSFEHPEVETVIDSFLPRRPKPLESSSASQILEAHPNKNIRELNFVLTQLLNQIEFERKIGEELKQMRTFNEKRVWMESSIEGLWMVELKQLKLAKEELRRNVMEQSNMLASDHGSRMPLPGAINHVHGRMRFQDCEETPETKSLAIDGGASIYLNFHHDNGIF